MQGKQYWLLTTTTVSACGAFFASSPPCKWPDSLPSPPAAAVLKPSIPASFSTPVAPLLLLLLLLVVVEAAAAAAVFAAATAAATLFATCSFAFASRSIACVAGLLLLVFVVAALLLLLLPANNSDCLSAFALLLAPFIFVFVFALLLGMVPSSWMCPLL